MERHPTLKTRRLHTPQAAFSADAPGAAGISLKS